MDLVKVTCWVSRSAYLTFKVREASSGSGAQSSYAPEPSSGHMSLCMSFTAWLKKLSAAFVQQQFPGWPLPGFHLFKYNLAKSSTWQSIHLMPSKYSESKVSWVLVRLSKPREALLEAIKWLRMQILEAVDSGLYHQLTIWPWTIHFTSLNPSFLICKLGEMSGIYLQVFYRRI